MTNESQVEVVVVSAYSQRGHDADVSTAVVRLADCLLTGLSKQSDVVMPW